MTTQCLWVSPVVFGLTPTVQPAKQNILSIPVDTCTQDSSTALFRLWTFFCFFPFFKLLGKFSSINRALGCLIWTMPFSSRGQKSLYYLVLSELSEVRSEERIHATDLQVQPCFSGLFSIQALSLVVILYEQFLDMAYLH